MFPKDTDALSWKNKRKFLTPEKLKRKLLKLSPIRTDGQTVVTQYALSAIRNSNDGSIKKKRKYQTLRK